MYYVPLKFVSHIGDEVTSGRGPYERDLLQLLYPLFDSEISTSAELLSHSASKRLHKIKLINYLIVHCLFSPVAIHTFAEEELRLETSSKGIQVLSSFLLVHCINLLNFIWKVYLPKPGIPRIEPC